jgi:hypothetical protein
VNENIDHTYLRLPFILFAEPDKIKQVQRILEWIQSNFEEFGDPLYIDLSIYLKQHFLQSPSPELIALLTPFIDWVYTKPEPISYDAKMAFFTSLKSIYENWGLSTPLIQDIGDKIHTIEIYNQITKNMYDITSKDEQKIQETWQLLHSIEAKFPQDFTLLNFHTCLFFVEEKYEKAFEYAELGLKAALPHQLWRAAFNVLNIAGILSNETRINEILESYKDSFQLVIGKRKHTFRKEKNNIFRETILTIREKFPNVKIPASYKDYL